jgi:hypothetical protein
MSAQQRVGTQLEEMTSIFETKVANDAIERAQIFKPHAGGSLVIGD